MGSSNDAGDAFATAMPIELGRHESNYFLPSADNTDFFRVKLEANKEYEVVAFLNEDPGNFQDLNLQIYDQDHTRLLNLHSAQGGLSTGRNSFATKLSGEYYIRVNCRVYDNPGQYTLEISELKKDQ